MATQVSLNSGAVASAGSLKLQTNGTTDAVTIDTLQNVGIGTSSPAQKFQVAGSGSIYGLITNTGTGPSNLFLGAANAQTQIISRDGTTGAVPTVFFQGTTESMRIDSSGNLALGTDTPGTVLGRVFRINGAAAGTNTGLVFSNALTDNGTVFSNSTQFTVGSLTSIPTVFSTNNTERMRIDTSGNLLVGTTSQVFPFSLVGAATSKALSQFYSSSAGDLSNPVIQIIKADNNSTTSQRFLTFLINNGSAGSGQINANGASQAAFGSYSDERLKENIVNLQPQLANIMALRPVEFDYKSGGHQTGFIAQEMQQVFPDAVGDDGSEDHYLTITGWNKTEAILVKAIQELNAKIDSLQETVTAQAAEIAALKGN